MKYIGTYLEDESARDFAVKAAQHELSKSGLMRKLAMQFLANQEQATAANKKRKKTA